MYGTNFQDAYNSFEPFSARLRRTYWQLDSQPTFDASAGINRSGLLGRLVQGLKCKPLFAAFLEWLFRAYCKCHGVGWGSFERKPVLLLRIVGKGATKLY